MSSKVLVIAAHPDDEVLGCGGTIKKLSSLGHEVHVLIIAEGETSRQEIRDASSLSSALEELKQKALAANKSLGVKSVKFLSLPDNRLDSVDLIDIIKPIEKLVQSIRPEKVYTHHYSDLNIDHKIVYEATLTACRPLPGQTVKQIFSYEVMSSTHWHFGRESDHFFPNWFEQITDQLEAKLEALRHYHSEMRDFPHARSYEAVEALAKWRGGLAGYKACEAFQLVRCLQT